MTGSFQKRFKRFWGDEQTDSTVRTTNSSTKTVIKQHSTQKIRKLSSPYPTHFAWRLLEWLFLCFDLFYITDFLVWISRFIKPNTRRLSEEEITLAKSIYGNSINFEKVLIDERAFIGPMTMQFAYVGFGVIHSWGPMRPSTFIHELVHVWQYQQLGAVYIPRALFAQHTPMGYNYGGIQTLEHAVDYGWNFLDFNYEQQGEILADYYCLRYDELPTFCKNDLDYIALFEEVMGTAGIGTFNA